MVAFTDDVGRKVSLVWSIGACQIICMTHSKESDTISVRFSQSTRGGHLYCAMYVKRVQRVSTLCARIPDQCNAYSAHVQYHYMAQNQRNRTFGLSETSYNGDSFPGLIFPVYSPPFSWK